MVSRDQLDFDVAIIGAGVAGLSAAVSASALGARVIVLEAGDEVGGSSRLSGGHILAAGTHMQRDAGILDDTPEALFEYYATLNQWMIEPNVVKRFCEKGAETLQWLCDLGIEFVPQVFVPGVNSVPREHIPAGAGAGVVEGLDAACSRQSVEIVFQTRVSELTTDDQGAVTGLVADGQPIKTGAVIIATGGFGANPEFLEKYFPNANAGDDTTWYIGCKTARGDGIPLGQSVGAGLDGHGRGLMLTSPGFSEDLEILLPNWAMMVNAEGRRFANENVHYTMMAGIIERAGGVGYVILDEETRLAAESQEGNRAYWVNDIIAKKADEGIVHRADTIKELAEKAGINPANLAGSIVRYNRDAQAGEDRAYLKASAGDLPTVSEAPFYAVEVRNSIICWTGTGLRINEDAQVLNEQEQIISGLYAAGEAVGSLHGDRYAGGGGSFGGGAVFGKLAGELATIAVTGNEP